MNVLSLGAGVQSSTVLLMSCWGVLPKLDAAIFADTGWEPQAVYDWLTVLEVEGEKAGIPIYRVKHGDIRSDAIRSKMPYNKDDGERWASMPLFTDNTAFGQLRRQCTKEYKIQPIERKVRELWGDQDRTVGCVSQWMGISGDEMRRCRTSRQYWIMFYYPLIFAFDRPWHRHDCVNWLRQHGFDKVPRSACLGCPYHSDDEWRAIKANPEQWADVVAFDEAIRTTLTIKSGAYLHRSCRPLPMVDLESLEDKGQQNWLNECEGMCGV